MSVAARLLGRLSSKLVATTDVESLDKLVILRDLPKARYANRPAITVYPAVGSRDTRKQVYSHLDVYKMVENVARTLRENGVRPKMKVATAIPNSLQAVVTFFALQWVNAITISLDPELDGESMGSLVKSVGASILITPHVDDDEQATDPRYMATEALAAQLGAFSWHVKWSRNEGVTLDSHGKPCGPAAWHGGSSDFTADPTEKSVYTFSRDDELTLVLDLAHQNVAAAAKAFAQTYDLFDTEAVSLKSSQAAISPESDSQTVLTAGLHDVQGILLLVASFYVGGKLVIPPSGVFQASAFWDMVEADGLTWVSVKQDQFLELYEATQAMTAPRKTLNFVRMCDEDSLDPSQRGAYEQVMGCPLLESYGPPEACGIVTSETPDEFGRGTMGRAVQACSVAIFSTGSERTMLGPNQEGEIAVKGDNVALGFMDNEDENALSLIKVTTDAGVEEEWLCTGDRGELDESGALRLTGSARALRAEARRLREAEAEAAALAAEEEAKRAELAAEEEAQRAALAAEEEAKRAALAAEEEKKKAEADAAAAAAAAAAATAAAATAAATREAPEPPAAAPEPASSDASKRIRRLTAEEIENVGEDWWIVTPFLGIPLEEDDQNKVVLMRRVPSGFEPEPTSDGSSIIQQITTPAALAAGGAAAAAAAEGGPVKKKVVKFGGVTYEYYYADEDDEEMLMELLGDQSETAEKKRTVKLPPKYKGGYYDEDETDELEKIQVRVMTAKEAGEFRRSLELEFSQKLEAEKARMKAEYEALLAAALRTQEEQFQRNFDSEKVLVNEEYTRRYDAAAEAQKAQQRQEFVGELEQSSQIQPLLASAPGAKDVAAAIALLQQKRAADRSEVIATVLLARKDLEEGVNKKLDDEINANLEQAVGTTSRELEVTAAGEAEDAQPLDAGVSMDKLGFAKKASVVTGMNDPDELAAVRTDIDPEFVEKSKVLKDSETNNWRSSVVSGQDRAAISLLRTIEDTNINDVMSYAAMLRTIENVQTSQTEVEYDMLYGNREEAFKARELGEALKLERYKMAEFSEQYKKDTLDPEDTRVFLNTANMSAIEASVLDAAASAEDGRAATEEAMLAAVKAVESAEAARASAEAAAALASGGAASALSAQESVTALSKSEPAIKAYRYKQVLPEDSGGDVVKKRTVSIDLKKVDAALAKHPSVIDARAFTTANSRTKHEIHAVVQLKKGAKASEPWLRQHAQSSLPLYSVPTRFFYTTDPIPPGRKSLAAYSGLKSFPGAPPRTAINSVRPVAS